MPPPNARSVTALPADIGPLVTVGIPAFNRPVELERAVRSALAQSYRRIEVLVSDDASPEAAVADIARALARADTRVRVVVQDRNLGHAANYQYVLDAARGEYFMWLADDDWIDPDYVSACLQALRDDPAAVMACGAARYQRDGDPVIDERALDLTAASANARVLRYFARVTLNGPLFSVAATGRLREVGFPDVIGGDWLLVGAMAARGKVRTLSSVHVHRSAAGLGSDARRLAETFGLRGSRAANHHLVVAGRLARSILNGAPYFSDLAPTARPFVAGAVAVSIVTRFTVAEWVRRALGPPASAWIEARISTLVRARDSR